MLSNKLHDALHEMSAREVRRNLKDKGCEELRQKGSHVQVKCGACMTTVPEHGSKDIATGTLKSIERSVNPCVGKLNP